MKKRITKKEAAKAKAQARREARAARKAPTQFKPGQSGNPAGPPLKELSRKQLELVIELKRKHLSESTIARAVDMSAPTFIAYKKTHPELQDALDYGKGLAQDQLVGRLVKQGIKNFVANIFLLKAQHGFSEGGEQASGPHAHVIINIPGAMQMGDLRAGDVIPLPTGDAPNVVRPSLPRAEREPIDVTPEREPGEAAPMPEAREHQPPRRQQTREEWLAVIDAEFKMGIRRDRASFDSEAAWQRYIRER
jgi:hypothetical protein